MRAGSVTEWADAYAWAPISSDKDRTPTNENSSMDGSAASSKMTKKHIRSQNNRHRKFENPPDKSRGLYAHVTIRDLITTKISKLSCVACNICVECNQHVRFVQHMCC